MQEKDKTAFRPLIIDGLLGAAILVLLGVCLMLLVTASPATWSECVQLLDTRDWSCWTWTGAGAALLGALLLVRLWPEKRR